MGKLIIIEGSDSSGKATQTKLIYERLKKDNNKVKKIEFPNYEAQGSTLVKMYLNGDFGKDPNDVGAYVASTFYTVDRYASFKTEWEEFYNSDGIIVSDRYTMSNMIHQAVKIADENKREEYLKWLEEFEFEKIKIPRPDLVVFLDIPFKVSCKLMEKRVRKLKNDIHEHNYDFLEKSYKFSKFLSKKYNWFEVKCVDGERIKTKEDIHNIIYQKIMESIEVI